MNKSDWEVLEEVCISDRQKRILSKLKSETRWRIHEFNRLKKQLSKVKAPPLKRAIEKNPETSRYYKAQCQSISRKKNWGLDRRTYNRLSSLPCVYCMSPTGNGIGLDRLDNSRGYFENNVVPCCGNCNLMRGNRLTYDEMIIARKSIA